MLINFKPKNLSTYTLVDEFKQTSVNEFKQTLVNIYHTVYSYDITKLLQPLYRHY